MISDFPKGRVRWVLINSLPLAPRPGSAPAGVVTTLADITDHVHAQHLLRTSEERYRGLVDSLPHTAALILTDEGGSRKNFASKKFDLFLKGAVKP